MRISDSTLRSIAYVLVFLLATQFANAAPGRQEQASSREQSQSASASSAGQPDPDTPNAPIPQDVSQIAQAQAPQSTSEQHPNPPAQPVGTAAAPYEKPTGVAASRPAGAVIAPGKQRRERAIVIRVAIIVGAAVAVGVVAGVSRSSSGRP